MTTATATKTTAADFVRRTLIDKLSGTVHTHWSKIREGMRDCSQVLVTVVPGACYGSYQILAHDAFKARFEAPNIVAQIIIHRGSSPDEVTRALVSAVLVDITAQGSV